MMCIHKMCCGVLTVLKVVHCYTLGNSLYYKLLLSGFFVVCFAVHSVLDCSKCSMLFKTINCPIDCPCAQCIRYVV